MGARYSWKRVNVYPSISEENSVRAQKSKEAAAKPAKKVLRMRRPVIVPIVGRGGDTPLNLKQRDGAREVGRTLRGKIDAIIASDLISARQIAHAIQEMTGAPIIGFTKSLRPLSPSEPLVKEPDDEKIQTMWAELRHIEHMFKGKRVAVIQTQT